MKKNSQFVCQNCGAESPRWLGQCPQCQEWNTLEEVKIQHRSKLQADISPISFSEIRSINNERIPTKIFEIDRVLGGGIVPGSVVLFGGEPGIGKSTLMQQLVSNSGFPVLYVSGEESPSQIKIRSDRISLPMEKVKILPEVEISKVIYWIKKTLPKLVVIDSIQTVYSEEIGALPGSLGQLRECTFRLINAAKELHIPIFIIGHVTKEGNIAGPKIIEHMVDTVLYFEGDKEKNFRILRSFKNRFGSINEVGIFEMKEEGLIEVSNPSEYFLKERQPQPGSVITSVIQGSRPILLEVQALVVKTASPVPRRTTVGIDYQRALMLIAIMERKINLPLGTFDVYLNVVGGIKVDDPAVDLAVAIAIFSSFKSNPISIPTIVLGEVGLTSEIRSIRDVRRRLFEAEKLGIKKAVIPEEKIEEIKGLDVKGVKFISQAIQEVLK
jgi:DNA repair protein RadA/Sms